jgi:hypothetical protein
MQSTSCFFSNHSRSLPPYLFLYQLFVIICLSILLAEAQIPEVEWEKSYGGSDDETGYSIRQTADGGFIMAGYSGSNDGDVSGNHGSLDFWIVKSDSAGNVTWQKSFGGSGVDIARSVLQTTDGGYIIAGRSSSDDGDVSGNHPDDDGYPSTDFWIIKLDNNGSLQWQKCLGGSNYEEARAVQQTTDGGFIVGGYTSSNDGHVSGNHGSSDFWIVKLSSAGNMEWQKCLGGSGLDQASSLQQVTDGGYIIVGGAQSNDGDVSGNHGESDYWIVKLNVSGDIEWQKSLGGSNNDYATDMLQSSDSGFIIVGSSSSNNGDVTGNHGESDYWIVKLNVSGAMEWQKSFGGSNIDYATGIAQSSDSGFIIVGGSSSNNGDVTGNHPDNYGYTTIDYWIVKIDSSENLQMQSSLGGSDVDFANSIHPTSDDGFIVMGLSSSNDGDISNSYDGEDYWVVKYSCGGSQTFYADSDNDTYGNINTGTSGFSCFPPAGYVADSSDCDDSDSNIYPGSSDIINGIDDNCNGYLDEPVIEWQISLGGSKNDIARSIQQTFDGGFIVAGSSQSNDWDVSGNQGFDDYWVAKLNGSGNIEWQKSLGGSIFDQATFIQQIADSGYIVIGYAESNDGDITGNHGYTDIWIVRLDVSGNTLWQKALGGIWSEYATSIQHTFDGGYILSGYSNSSDGDVSGNHGNFDFWIVKVDSLANIQWQRSLGGGKPDYGNHVQQTKDGGFIIAGESDSNNGDVSGNHGNFDSWIVKLDSSGTIQWQNSYGGSGDDGALSIRQTLEGGFIVAGYSESNNGDVSGNHGSLDYWIVRLDAAGNLVWQKCLGGSGYDIAQSVIQTVNGGFIVAGLTSSNDGDVSGNHGQLDYWIVKLNQSGTIEWQQCLGGNNYDEPYSISQTSIGELIIAGYSDSEVGDVTGNYGLEDYWLVKLTCDVSQFFCADLDGDGFGDANVLIAGPACLPPAGYVYDSTDCDDSNALVFPGAFEIPDNEIDDDCDGTIDESSTGVFSTNKIIPGLSLFPNPNDGRFTIYLELNSDDNDLVTIEVINLLGQIVYDKTSALFNGKLLEEINLNDRSSGMYLIKVFINDRVYWGPLISKIK